MVVITLPLKMDWRIYERNVVYSRRYKMTNEQEASPFVKWAGGKSKLVEIILEKVQEHIDLNTIEHYIEPFVGGGAMFFYLANRYDFKTMTIMDINIELINTYKAIQKSPNKLIQEMDNLQNHYNQLATLEEKEAFYYDVRKEYNNYSNKEKLEQKIDYRRAAQFIFLNKTCFNGLYRVNRSGGYNVPFGKKNEVNIYNELNIRSVHELLKRTKIIHGDYQQTLQHVRGNTFVYFDPPYRPISNSAAFTAYDESGFNDTDQECLAKLCMQLYIRGVHFAVSNSDPHNSDPSDMFFDNLYQNFEIYRITASRQIAASSDSRKPVSEILVVG